MSQTSAVQLNLSSASLLYVWRNSGYLWTHICFVHKSSMFRKSTSFDYLCTRASVVPSLLFGCGKSVDLVLLLQILTDLSFSDMCRHGTLSVVCMMKQLQDVLLEGIFTNMRGKWLDEHPS